MSGNAIFISLILMVGCESSFIPDPINPELPKYTEQGLDIAGAYLNDQLWKAPTGEWCFICSYDPLDIRFDDQGYREMVFHGELPNSQNVSFYFHLNILNMNPNWILSLKDQKIKLDGTTKWVDIINRESNCSEITHGKGQIYFRSIKKYLDTKHYIVSGTFSAEFNDGAGCAANVTYGRFDFVQYTM